MENATIRMDMVIITNSVVKVVLTGPIDQATGMLINISSVKEIIKSNVLDILDHRNLDLDLSEYFGSHRPSTTENVAKFIWERLVDSFVPPVKLYEVQLKETDKNIVAYRG